jgi:hypothetical protein
MHRGSDTLAIGCAAGFGGDRAGVAVPVVETLIRRGGPSALIFEVLAERTLALAQLDKRRDPQRGYAPMMEAMLAPVLERCVRHGIPIVSNFGAANPRAAALRVREMLPGCRVAIVEGDDLSGARDVIARYMPVEDLVSANVYLGGSAIAGALRAGAQVVITGRVADPALVVGPAMAHFGIAENDWDALACATIAGHLLECGAQVTGGYFADPGYKDVADLHDVGFPIAELPANGAFVIGKAENTGGCVNAGTVKEQLLYEVHDPAAYLTPDVTADISEVDVFEVGPDRVEVRGVRGHARPDTLKMLAWFPGGWLGEGEISYAGPNAAARARLAAEIVRRRLGDSLRMRFDLIGLHSVFGDGANLTFADHDDVRLRVAASHEDRSAIERLTQEVLALYTCGPAGGGGIRTNITQRLRSVACLIPRELAPARFEVLD